MENINEKIRKSLKYSVIDGAFYCAMVGFGESFFSAFAVFLKASNIQLGLIGSLPQTIGSLSQLYSNKLLKVLKSRQKLVCIGAFLQGLMYLPLMFVFYFGSFRVWYFIMFICLYWILGMILGPAWNSWIGDLVNEKEKGVYFGKRNKIAGFVSFVSFLIAGYILQRFSDGPKTQNMGFILIFFLALISRMLSTFFLLKKYDPEYKITNESQLSLIKFLKQARTDNFGLLTLYMCTLNFGVYIAAPFFTPYMLQDLSLNYKLFTIVSAVTIIIKFILMPVWGGVVDRYGTKKVLSVSGFLMPLIPLLWVFSYNLWYLIIIQAYSGFIWAGFEIAAFNCIFDTTTPQKRVIFIAYYNVLNGVAIFLGALAGGFIVKYNHMFWSKYYLVFIISFALRYAASLIFIPKLKEVRQVESISYGDLLFKVITTMPTKGIVYNLITYGRTHRSGTTNRKN
ncbi:MAG: hypothetical protein A2161_10295 [Candidatus Schekmanbacteria bacterium RBG_13_48_7]|uniref:Major facilitator superfamily (MFS) profile domain-containing protein n=1 Tax=Candidatus Schekmanbacteria bacterium RBG_13_48_7 TaxID=1817878 RepID=A0A1F7S231_9BACT|nr:MAG: hypothetical protein A2161_10295 [Candidatus Schekmanbacteria bacterium RBG_13_48_7]